MSLHRIRLECVVELPDGDERIALYSGEDPEVCIVMDFENDPPAFLLEQCDEMELIYLGEEE